MNDITFFQSIIKYGADSDMVEALTYVAEKKGFIWPDHSLKRGEVRVYKLFRYLIETHPDIEEAIEEAIEEVEFNDTRPH